MLWEKGTNRASFFRGEVNKYGWVDTGSSFLPSEITAAFLFAQLENIDKIQKKRISNWHLYYNALLKLQGDNKIKLPVISQYATNNGHMFYIICKTEQERSNLIKYLKENDIYAVFHYLSLHKSEYIKSRNNNTPELPMSDFYMEHLLRLPMYYELSDADIKKIVDTINEFYK